MSSFVALNIELDEESEEDFDNTKEIQIEEALKLYQNALKLHSQGPLYYDQAQEAYKELFESEIFKYPESLSEYERIRTHGASVEAVDFFEEPGAVTLDANDTVSSALPQTIYLSYKNHGQFILDKLKHSLQRRLESAAASNEGTPDVSHLSTQAISYFAEALERDDTDLELWRKSARIGDAVSSHRLARFCLESVLDGEDEGLEERVQQLGLEEVFAIEDLRGILQSLQDNGSLAQFPDKKPRRALLHLLKKGSDPYPYLPSGLKEKNDIASRSSLSGPQPSRRTLTPGHRTWSAVGTAILRVLLEEKHEAVSKEPVTAIELSLPDNHTVSPALPVIQRKPEDDQKDSGLRDVEMQTAGPSPTAKDVTQPGEVSLVGAPTNHAEDGNQPSAEGKDGSSEKQAEQPTTVEPQKDENRSHESSIVASRKRSSASVAIEEPQDGGRVKSKRIRARESNAEALAQPEEVVFDQTKYFEDRLEIFAHADQWMFGTVGSMLSKLGVEELGTIEELKKAICAAQEGGSTEEPGRFMTPGSTVFKDLRDVIKTWNEAKGQAYLHSEILPTHQKGIGGATKSGLNLFFEHSKQVNRNPGTSVALLDDSSLPQFAQRINEGWFHPREAAFMWLQSHLMPSTDDADNPSGASTYMAQKWPDDMRETVTHLLWDDDEYIYERFRDGAFTQEQHILSRFEHDEASKSNLYSITCAVQSIYELHLSIYSSMDDPDSETDAATRTAQRDRVGRWCSLSYAFISRYMTICDDEDEETSIILRYLWSHISQMSLLETVEREYVIYCLQNMKQLLASAGNPEIQILNNTFMPEISVAAADQEIFRLNSMDFFSNILSPGLNDPVYLIESIEPILEPSSVQFTGSQTTSTGAENDGKIEAGRMADTDMVVSRARSMAEFLDRGDATLRLFLWRKLQIAYDTIQYPPKVVSCCLRSIEVIVRELQSPTYLEAPAETRQFELLKWIKAADELLTKVLKRVLDEPKTSFDCFDMDHLRASMSAIAQLSKILHSYALFEDSIRVGQISLPESRPAAASKSLEQFKKRLRSMQIRAWIVQYALLTENIDQNKELFDTPFDDRVHFLRSVHNAIGLRLCCKYADKMLLKLMKTELLTLPTEDSYETDIAQVLFDLYGLKFTSGNDGAVDHDCPMELLDRDTAILMIDFVMMQANRMNIKDLSKSELKSTMDTMQRSIEWGKSSSLSFNKRVMSAFLKAPINPSELFRAIQGIGEVSFIPVHTDSAEIAKKGWFYLLGFAALTKFRSQKRITPVPTDDLDNAIKFFRRDIEHGTAKWESWYRLAQVYDLKLEEDIAWTADKLNSPLQRPNLVTLQRQAMHAYCIAVATAIQTIEPSPEANKTLSELYTDFAFRIYASTRAPLSMEAFSLAEFERHFSSGDNQQMYKGKPFKDMNLYSAWNFASYLLRQAIVERPKHWKSRYLLSKCLWKMFSCDDPIRGNNPEVPVSDVVDSLIETINALPEKRDTRSDPILEPHYKLVTIVHKLVQRGHLTPAEGSEKLSATQYARNVTAPEGTESWKRYILDVLKHLRHADKSNWHHRIVARIAHIMYDGNNRDDAAAAAAKHELSQQIFTKTMTLQVWRPENERAGRHFVFTARYVYFFVHLLDQLNDRVNMDQLIRRVRRKPSDFVNHAKLCEDIFLAYVKLFRRVGNIPEGLEETVFKPVTLDDFLSYSSRLEAAYPSSPEDTKTMELLRDAVELKKINANLMRPAVFEDLVADTYAVLYQANLPKFMEQVTEEESRERMKVDHLLMANEATDGTQTPPAAQAPGPKPRTKGVSKKELQRKADAIATKSLTARLAAKPAKLAEEEPRLPRVQVAVPPLSQPQPEPQSEQPEPPSEAQPPPPPTKEEAKGDISAIQSSAPGSIHDSADDESELSEVDEEKLLEPSDKPASLMFPNLMKRMLSPKPGSEMSTNVSSVDGGDVESAVTAPASVQDTKSEPADARPSDMEVE